MAKIHLILQGKGGVGKSFIAAIMAQYKESKGEKPFCIDTDPINGTLFGYKGLQVKQLKIMDGDDINSRHFDTLVELVTSSAVDVIIDNGASSFVPLSSYLIGNQVPTMLAEQGQELVVHTVITGGQALSDTVNGFSHLIKQFPAEVQFVVWLNPYWGPIAHEGRSFEEMKAYTANKNRVTAIVQMPELKEETFGRDLSDMLQERLTFDEALAMASRTIMTRQRLTMIRRDLFGQLEKAMVL